MELIRDIIVGTIFFLLALTDCTISDSAENTTDVHEASVEEVPNPTMTIERGDLSDYRLPGYYTFNNGEPFYLEKDPLTGAVDFTKKSPLQGHTSTPIDFTSASKQDRVNGQDKVDLTDSEYYEDEEVSSSDQDFKEDGIDRKDGNIDGNSGYRPNEIDKNPFKISADLHQFLNLPVHYSSSDKFPLISSSYANTKIQGTGSSSNNNNNNNNNNNGYSNHKYSTTSSTQSPSYYTLKRQSTSTTTMPTTTKRTTITTTPFPTSTATKSTTTSIDTEQPPLIFTTSKPKITTKSSTLSIGTTTTTTTTSMKPPYSEYVDGEDLVYSDYDMEYGQPHNSHSGYYPSSTVSSTSKSNTPDTVFKPTAISTVDEYITYRPPQNYSEEEEEEFEEDNVSIVTSLPVDVYYSQHPQTTASTSTTTTATVVPSTVVTTPKMVTSSPSQTTASKVISTTTELIKEPQLTTMITAKPNKLTPAQSTSPPTSGTIKFNTAYNDLYKPTAATNYHHYYGTKDHFEPIVDEPFRPIFGPHETSSQPSYTHKLQPTRNVVKPTPVTQSKPYIEYHSPSNAKPLPNQGKIEFVERIPNNEQNKYAYKPNINPPKYPGVEPPRPNPPVIFSNQGNKEHSVDNFSKPSNNILVQSNPPLFNNEKQNVNGNPTHTLSQHESVNYLRPQSNSQTQSGSLNNNPALPNSDSPVRNPSQNQQRPPFIRLPEDVVFHMKKNSNGSVVKLSRPEEIIYPQQRPVGVLPPSGLKTEIRPTNQVVKFHPPMKHDNHFIKVPLNEENPSYSLQTSFSIGMPNGDHVGDRDKDKNRPSQGVGQVLFPDGSPDTSLQPDNDKPLQSPPLRIPPNTRPPSTRPYITSYNQNNPQQGRPPPPPPPPSSQLLPQRPSQRLPVPELRPPKPNGDSYPRPYWESHSKPHIVFNPQHNSGPKPEIPPPYPAINRVKSDPNIQRPDLPNILPQFRPNAKVGSNEFAMNIGSSDRLREPMDTLQPPPLPQPQLLRANRNDDSGDELEKTFETTQLPLVHRRTGSQASNRVTTLQMMQQSPPRRNLVRTDYHDHRQERPVFLVYPANAGTKPQVLPSDSGVVIGTRGPHQPLPPSNLDTPTTDNEEEDIDTFPLDDSKQFSLPTRDRVDTPILKTKTSAKPTLKNDFPYEILKPQENILPEERILAGNVVTKEYNAFSPTVSSSTEEVKDHDSEINLIPYLQDYMPFATKKPITSKPGPVSSQLLNVEKNSDFVKMPSTVKPISVTLNTKLGTTSKPETTSEYIKHPKPLLPTLNPHETGSFVSNNGGKSEYTVGAVMHTHYQKKPVNHRPFEITSSNQPKPLDLEAPFQASLSAPQSQGWTVVKSNPEKHNQEIDRHDSETEETQKISETSESKFDFDNFKPQLFGGFKPIIPSSTDNKSENMSKDNTEEKTISSTRQEKRYR